MLWGFKEKEINLKNEIRSLKEDIFCLQNKLALYQHLSGYEKDFEQLKKNRESELKDLRDRKIQLDKEISLLSNELTSLKKEIQSSSDLLGKMREDSILTDIGLYAFKYKLESSDIYKEKLERIRNNQKRLIKSGNATCCLEEWTVNGSTYKGQLFIDKLTRQILRCFNNECDFIISKVKYNNLDISNNKIDKAFKTINNLNIYNKISITGKYLNLKREELTLAYEYELKKHQEKEERRIERERLREEEKLMEEIEEKRKDVEKELKHYNKQKEQIKALLDVAPEEDIQYLLDREIFIDGRISQLSDEISNLDYREANKKAGYVYIISNIGSFGENVYKIGMTRRLEPTDRIDELSSASVPFKFDIHAMMFCEDAPKLEAELHRAFEKYKVNAVNSRKEFFKVSIEEIKKEVRKKYDKTVEFFESPYSDQYLRTIEIRAEQ